MTTLPPTLTNAVKDQRAVLFLGAGASLQATHPAGKTIPEGHNLRNIICDTFLEGQLKDKPLSAVSAIVANEVGLSTFQSFIRDLFEPFQPADFHLLLPTFRWRAIITTNFDLIVERAYAQAPGSLQNLVKTVKDGDGLDVRLHKETHPVGLYKLHGCIDHYNDPEIPIILGNEQYASYEVNRSRFYARFRDLGFEYPIIFAGYSISDPHIQRILFDLTDPSISRPSYFIVLPRISDVESRYWASNRVTALDTTFQKFLTALDTAIPSLARAIPLALGGGELSIRKHYQTAGSVEPPSVASYFSTDATHVHAGLVAPRQDPKKFYRGYDDGWGCILQDLDVHRTFSDSVLVDAVLLSEEDRQMAELFVLKGPGGNGKTVSLKRIAWEAGVTYDQLAIFPDSAAGVHIEPLADIHRLTGKRLFLFVDRIALVRNELKDLLHASRARSIPVSVVGTERYNEWNIYCEHLEPFVRQEFAVRYLSEMEIKHLLDLLENHDALGMLASKSAEARVEAFTESAGRQLLVALHEATLGVPFEDIIVDEYRRIEPAEARDLYLDICALHQFGAPVRAGLISRASGLSFDKFKKELMAPLENVVEVVEDKHSLDIYYSSRHRHISEIVFNRILPTPEDKFDHLARILTAINIDYSSDRETFSRLIRGRRIAEMFPNPELGRLFYDRVQAAVPSDAFVFHQRAVFEIQHRGGSLVLADDAARRAFELNPRSDSIQHTQAEIARRSANETDDPLRKQALRRRARGKLGGGAPRVSEYDLYTRARLAVDEVSELVVAFEASGEESAPASFLEGVKEAEITIQNALQVFPESSEILATEATFREKLNQTYRAHEALERAFNLNPRQDWLAVRLARKYVDSGDIENGKRVLSICLHDNPGSKVSHLEMGRILAFTGDTTGAIEHLRRSFTEGDSYYEGQFWYARELFIQGHYDEAKRLFSALGNRSPGRFRTRAGAPVESGGNMVLYEGQMRRKEEGYGFIRLVHVTEDVFASRSESKTTDWDALYAGVSVEAGLAFNRRGARAISVRSSTR